MYRHRTENDQPKTDRSPDSLPRLHFQANQAAERADERGVEHQGQSTQQYGRHRVRASRELASMVSRRVRLLFLPVQLLLTYRRVTTCFHFLRQQWSEKIAVG